MSTDARTYENSAEFDGKWFSAVAQFFKSPGQWYLKVAIDFAERSEDREDKTSYNPIENTLTMRGHSSSTTAFDTGKTQGAVGVMLALLPAIYGGMTALAPTTASGMLLGASIALFLIGVSTGALHTVLNWTVVDERVERPETEDVIEQYVDGEIENEDELERQLEASLE